MAVSFLILALLPPSALDRFWRRRLPLFAFGDIAPATVSLISFAGFAILVVAGADSAWWLWNLQAGIIIAGKVLAVLIAHGLAWRLHQQASRAALSQLPQTG